MNSLTKLEVGVSYEAQGVRCSIGLVLLDAAAVTTKLLVDIDPVALRSYGRQPRKYEDESDALLRVMRASDSTSVVCIRTMVEVDKTGYAYEPASGPTILVLRAALAFFVEAGALSTSSLVLFSPVDSLVSYYRLWSFQSVDECPSIRKTTIAELLAVTTGPTTSTNLQRDLYPVA